MVTVRVFGTTPPCAKCKRAEREAEKAAQAFPGQVEVVKVDALAPEAAEFGVMMTPTVVVGQRALAAGRIVPAAELKEEIRKALGG